MSTITRERVQWLHDAATEFLDTKLKMTMKPEEIIQLTTALLAALEAEPVADVVAWSSPNEERTCDVRLRRHDIKPGPLYTAPQAPVSVPTFDEWLEIRGNKPLGWVKDAMRESYDACRAAMLQGAEPVSNRDELPIWVACSERMPDETQPVITVSDGGVVQRTVYQFCEGVWSDWYEQYDDVKADAFTHWMPLPAAPQQEV